MTGAALKVLDSLNRLPEPEREEVVAAILRGLVGSDYGSPSEIELLQAADAVFLDLDHDEDQE